MITQGQCGRFVCTITEFGVVWTFGTDGSLEFLGTRMTGDFQPDTNTNTFARLLMRNITGDLMEGRRTSVLYFEPDPEFTGLMNISCQGISPATNSCVINVSVIGEFSD